MQQPRARLYRDEVDASSSWTFEWSGHARSARVSSSSSDSSSPLVQLVADNDPPLVVAPAPPSSSSASSLELVVSHAPLKDFFAKLDKLCLDVCTSKCHEWFGKAMRPEEVATLQRPSLTPGSKLRVKTAPSTRVWSIDVDSNSGAWAYAQVGEGLSAVRPGCQCWITVSVESLFFLPRLFGVSYVAQDVLLLPRPERHEKGFPFITSVRVEEKPDGLPVPSTFSSCP